MSTNLWSEHELSVQPGERSEIVLLKRGIMSASRIRKSHDVDCRRDCTAMDMGQAPSLPLRDLDNFKNSSK